MNFLTKLRGIVAGKFGSSKKHAVADKKSEVWDLVPDFFDTVPMPLVHFTLSQLALGNTKDSPHFHAPIRDADNDHLEAMLSYDVFGAYFCGGTLCLDVRITYFYEAKPAITSKSTILITMSATGTIPHWFDHCVSLPVTQLALDKLSDAVVLSAEAELWLRVVYLTNNPELRCTPYIRERSSKELLKKAIQFIDKHNVPFQEVPHQQAEPTAAAAAAAVQNGDSGSCNK